MPRLTEFPLRPIRERIEDADQAADSHAREADRMEATGLYSRETVASYRRIARNWTLTADRLRAIVAREATTAKA